MQSSAIRAGRAFVELFADDSMLVRTLRQAENRVVRFGEKINAIGRRLTALGLAAAAPFAASLHTYAKFDDVMRAVKAVTSATAKEFEILTEKAKFLGRTTSFTSSQIAEAMLALGRAGFAPQEIDNSITGVLDLARATRTDLAETTRIASSALRAFNLPAEEMTRVCDVMVAASNTSSQTLEDLGHSMAYCAPIAEKYGLSLEQTCKAIGALSNYGIKASQAGTTFRRIMVNLSDRSIQRRLKGLGVAVQDIKTGEMRDVAAILKDLGVATQKMAKGDKLTLFKEVFGVWALAGGASLTTAEFERLYDAIDNADGLARRTAKDMDSGLAGSLRMLWSAVEAVAIAIGEALNPVLQPLVDWMTKACSGMVVYITHNKQLIVSLTKTITAVTGTGIALFTLGAGFIVVGKIIGSVAAIIAGIAHVFLSAFRIIQGCLSAAAFVGQSFASVFSAIVGTITGVCTTMASGLSVATLVLLRLGTVAFTVISGLARVMLVLGTGIVGAVGLIMRSVIALTAVLVPVIASILPMIVSTLSTSLSLLAGAVIGIVSLIASTIVTLFPIITTALAAMGTVCSFALTVIAAGIAAAFATIVPVIQAAFVSVGMSIATLVSGTMTMIGSIIATVGSAIAAVLTPILTAVSGFCTTLAAMIGSMLTAIGGFISAFVTSMVTGFVTLFAYVVGGFATALGHMIAIVGTAIGSILASMAPILVVIVTIAAAVGAAYLLVGALSRIASVIADAFTSLAGIIGRCLESMMWSVAAFGVAVAGQLIRCFSWIVSGLWEIVRQIGTVLAAVISNAVIVIQGVLNSAWNGLVASFHSAVTLLGKIISALGTFFLNVFDDIGTAVNWLREQFGHLCTSAIETYDALVAALGRGDIEAAIQLIWASIKLIWVKGSTSLLSTWYWVVETLQTSWAGCIFKISELLTVAWSGVQQFWTESVYTMGTLWAEFSHGVVSAWKKAEESIAQGVGWITAKMQGLDPNEMSNIIAEDYNRQSRDRENDKSRRLTDLQSNRDKRMALLEAEKEGTLDILKSDFDQAAGVRNAAYQAKLAAQEREL